MKILVIGGTGTIGQAVVNELQKRHDIVVAGHQSGDIQIDMTQPESIEKMFQKMGHELDAVIAAAGNVRFADFASMTTNDYYLGLNDKLMGQVNLVLIGKKYIKSGGSFTLTSGILNHDPIRAGSSAAMVNGALEGFVKSAAIEMPNNLRINLVSPTVVAEAMYSFEAYFHGFSPVPASQVALAYSKSVEGLQTGQVYRVGYVVQS